MTPEIREASAELATLVGEFFDAPRPATVIPIQPAGLDDERVIATIRRSRQAAKFDGLWRGDTSEYAGDDSAADMALCSILAFYCHNEAQVDRIFRGSSLIREKWDSRRGDSTYGRQTIAKAWSAMTSHYSPIASLPPRKEDRVLPVEAPAGLFVSASDLASLTPEEVAWVVRGLLARGCITELDAKVKVGKTTLIGHLIASIFNGENFLGFETTKAIILLLTEERESTVRAMLDRCGLLTAVDLHILSLYKVQAFTWEERVSLAIAEAKKINATVLIVDTLSKWAGIVNENDTGEAQAAMLPIEAAAAQGLAVLVNRHDRKGGGDVGDSGRGASAFSGAADIILHLQRANVEGHPNRRILAGAGRFDDVPDVLVIELTEDGYVNLGDQIEIERREAREKLMSILPTSRHEALVEATIIEAATPVSRTSLRRAMEDLLKDGTISRDKGFGTRGTAFGYWLNLTDQQYPTSGQLVNQHLQTHVTDFDVGSNSHTSETLLTSLDTPNGRLHGQLPR